MIELFDTYASRAGYRGSHAKRLVRLFCETLVAHVHHYSTYRILVSFVLCVNKDDIRFIGVINCTSCGGSYATTSNWLCIPFEVSQNAKVDLLQNINVVESGLLTRSGPMVISRTEKNTVVNLDEIRKFGMSIATIHVR